MTQNPERGGAEWVKTLLDKWSESAGPTRCKTMREIEETEKTMEQPHCSLNEPHCAVPNVHECVAVHVCVAHKVYLQWGVMESSCEDRTVRNPYLLNIWSCPLIRASRQAVKQLETAWKEVACDDHSEGLTARLYRRAKAKWLVGFSVEGKQCCYRLCQPRTHLNHNHVCSWMYGSAAHCAFRVYYYIKAFWLGTGTLGCFRIWAI